MTSRARIGALVAALVVIAGAAALSRRSSPPPPAPPRPRHLACAFAPGDTLAWRLVVRTEGDAGPSQHLRATLRLAVRAPAVAGGWVMAARVDPVDGFDRPDELRVPFALRVARNCRFDEFAWPAEATAAQADAIARLVTLYDTALGDGARDRWTAAHRDDNGQWFTDYRVTAWDPRATEVESSAGPFENTAPDAQVEQVERRAHFVLDGEGRWLRTMQGTSLHRVRSEGVHLDVRLAYRLERIDDVGGAALPDASAVAAMRWRRPEAPAQAQPEPDARQRARERAAALASVTVDDALSEATRLFDGDRDPAHDRAFQYLLAWLLGHEGAAAELLARIRDGRTDARLDALLFLALEQADTPASRRVLAAALADRALSSMNRQRAMLALASTRTPTPEALTALRDAARAPGRGEEAEVERGVALRAAGTLAGDGVPREVSEPARAMIRASVASGDVAVRRGGLDAAGNARTAELLPEIRAALDDRDQGVRAAAAHALRGLDRDTAQPLLAARLTREEDRVVRQEVVGALLENARGRYDDDTVRALVDALPRTAEASVRAQVIRALGQASTIHSVARAALVSWVPREPEAELLQLIGQYLDLATMREALSHRDR